MKSSFLRIAASLAFGIILAIGLNSCVPVMQANSKPAPAKKTINFDYEPSETKAPGSAEMTIAMIDPAYNDAFAYSSFEMFQRFGKSLEADIEEMLIAHGYRLKGPFSSLDELVIGDKQSSDLALVVNIDPELLASGSWDYHPDPIFGNSSYSYSGNISVLGKIGLVAIEPLTGEKVWAKSIEIPIENVAVSTYNRYNQSGDLTATVLSDVGIYNPLGEAMLEAYKGIMTKTSEHIAPEEFHGLRGIIKELKDKKAY